MNAADDDTVAHHRAAAPPVVLVHGWGGSFEGTYGRSGWREALAARGREVVEINLPGHADLHASHRPEDYTDLAGEVAAMLPGGLLDAVGFSLGAKLTLELAARDPGKFRRIVIAGVGNRALEPEKRVEAATMVAKGLTREGRAAMPRLASYLDRSPHNHPDAIAAVLMRQPPNPTLTPEWLTHITAEALILNGDEDEVAIPDDALRAAVRHREHVLLPGVDHFSLPEEPALLAKAIEFLTRD
jgi:pimeloyl-ACP methyl ester carboxylesterase